jgi:hypothetical protein
LKPPGCRWTWSVAQLRENRAPEYVQEFISILAKRPLYAEFSPKMRSKKNGSPKKAEAA